MYERTNRRGSNLVRRIGNLKFDELIDARDLEVLPGLAGLRTVHKRRAWLHHGRCAGEHPAVVSRAVRFSAAAVSPFHLKWQIRAREGIGIRGRHRSPPS